MGKITKRVEITQTLEQHSGVEEDITAWMELVRGHEQIEELDRSTVVQLVDSIEIEEQIETGGKRSLEVWINYRFLGKIPKHAERAAPHGDSFGLAG